MENYRSLTDNERWDLNEEVKKANPGVDPRVSWKEFSAIKRAVILKKALEARDSSTLSPSLSSVEKDQASMDSPSALLNLGTIKPVDDLTLKALQGSQSQVARPYSCLTLTKEERGEVYITTKIANPDANHEAIELAYKIALWKADSQKRGINPGGNPDTVDLSLSSLSDSKNGSGEESDTSEDGVQDKGNNLLRQKQVSSPSSPKENEYLDS